MEIPETRYAWNGDVSLAYQIIGDGPIDLLYLPGVLSNVDVMWESIRYTHFLQRLASFSRLIVMDRRGCGCSERFSPYDVGSIEVMVDDLLVVLDAAASERTALFSFGEANFITCLAAASFPDRVSHAILLDPSPTYLRDDEITWEWSHRDWDEVMIGIRRDWGVYRGQPDSWAPSLAGDLPQLRWLKRFERLRQSPGLVIAESRKHCDTDVRGILPSIKVPTLVLRRGDGPLVDPRSPEYVAEHISDAKLVEVPGRDHYAWTEGADALVEEIEEFVTGARQVPNIDRVLATILFTDIVGSTEKQVAIGDQGWKELILAHHGIVRDALGKWGGEENDTAGDGFFATFDGPARAVHCALDIAARVRDLGIETRAGVHTGECELIDGKAGGIAVSIGARISSIAGASEVLVSDTLKGLVAGSGLTFEDAGEYDLKGAPDRWHLYRVVG